MAGGGQWLRFRIGERNDSGKGVSIVWTRDACFWEEEENADAMLGDIIQIVLMYFGRWALILFRQGAIAIAIAISTK